VLPNFCRPCTSKTNKSVDLNITWRCSIVAKQNLLLDRLAGASCRQAPSAFDPSGAVGITWRDKPHRQAPYVLGLLWILAVA